MNDFGTRTKTPYTDGHHINRGAVLDRYPKTPEEMPMPWTSSDAEFNEQWVAAAVKRGIPEAKVHELMVRAQVAAFRDAMRFARNHGLRVDFPSEAEMFELFKTYERDILEALVAQFIVENGIGEAQHS